MAHLHDVFYQHLGDSVLSFTTDGNADFLLKCGATPKAYATVDFGPTGGKLILDSVINCNQIYF